MAARSKSKGGSARSKPTNLPKNLNYYRVNYVGVANPGVGYRHGQAVTANMPGTIVPWSGRITGEDSGGQIATIREIQIGALRSAPSIATVALQSFFGRGATATFSFTHVIP